MKNKNTILFGGLFAGIVNGLLGTGGGIIAIPLLTFVLKNRQRAHSTVMAFVLPLSICSLFFYFSRASANWQNIFYISIGGIFGAITGALLLNKLSGKTLKIIFAILIIASGIGILL